MCLQPGIYYLNPRMVKVTIVPVGYDLSHARSQQVNTAVHFYSQDGYAVEADFTVVWGRTPADAPEIVANIGNTQRIEQNVIIPTMKAACQNEGSKYTAVELIQGMTRSQVSGRSIRGPAKQVSPRHISVLLALVRNIAIKDKGGDEPPTGLALHHAEGEYRSRAQPDQQAKNRNRRQASRAWSRRTSWLTWPRKPWPAETRVKTANIMADAARKAAETDAQRDLSVAAVNLEVAQLDAQRIQILGKAKADVDRMKNEAEAKGAKLMVDALGSPQAYNQYIFAKNFEPTDLKLIFAGPGTFWTDLKSFQEVGAAKMVAPKTVEEKTAK